jgi:hypothetical protein
MPAAISRAMVAATTIIALQLKYHIDQDQLAVGRNSECGVKPTVPMHSN